MIPIYSYESWNKCEDKFIKRNEISSVLKYSSLKSIKPDVTVAIPSYKRVDTIKEAVDSALKQKTTYAYIIMVVDDSGENNDIDTLMEAYVNKYENILYYKNESNLGQAGNWNRCMELSPSRWTILLHDDDMLKCQYIQTVMPIAIRTNCSLLGVFQEKYDLINHRDNRGKKFNKKQTFAQEILSKLRSGAAFQIDKTDVFQFILPSPGCWLIDKDKAISLGGFDDKYEMTLDGMFHFKNIYYFKVIIVPQFLMIRRIEKNIFLKPEAQLKVINMLYFFCLNLLNEYKGIKKWIYKKILNISIVYMGKGIKDKYESEIDMDGYLADCGVDKFLIKLPKFAIYLLNNFFLLKLIFRKHITG